MSRTGYRPHPLQQNFPSNTPVVSVRPFSWRPPSMSYANTSISISFPVMVGNSIVQSQRTASLPSIARNTSSTNNPFLSNLLSTLQQSLTTSNLISNEGSVSSSSSSTTTSTLNTTTVVSSSAASDSQQTSLSDSVSLTNDAAMRRKEIEELLLKVSSNQSIGTQRRPEDVLRLNQLLSQTQRTQETTRTVSSLPFNVTLPQSRPNSSASNEVIVLDDSDED